MKPRKKKRLKQEKENKQKNLVGEKENKRKTKTAYFLISYPTEKP